MNYSVHIAYKDYNDAISKMQLWKENKYYLSKFIKE
ncbi:hypothetical protein INTERNEXUS_129 [Bacillus phage vB_BspM_Internexus]|nr:hypothetical protein INTERNEXUS_129 [Bacillus phage vB_BspM_Internexus]